jgi:formiminotetrahydrofolate cyclodeaminase
MWCWKQNLFYSSKHKKLLTTVRGGIDGLDYKLEKERKWGNRMNIKNWGLELNSGVDLDICGFRKFFHTIDIPGFSSRHRQQRLKSLTAALRASNET